MVRPPTRHLGDYYDVMPGTDDNGSPYDVKKSYCMTVGIVTTAIVFTIGCAVLCNYLWRQYFGHDSHRPPPKGLRKNVIKNLPKQVFKSKPDSEGGGGDNNEELADCAICLTGFVDGDEIRVLPQCRHGFHVTCIDTWLGNHSSCPSCRQIVIVKCRMCNKFCDEANNLNQNQNQNQNRTQNANTNVNPSSADLEAGSSVAREGRAREGEDSNKAV